MTNMLFTFAAFPPREGDPRTPVKLFAAIMPPTRTDNPGDERRAAKEALKVVRAVLGTDGSATDAMAKEASECLAEGEMPVEAAPMFTFGISVAYDRANRMGHYKYLDCRTLVSVAGCGKISAEGADLRAFLMERLRAYEAKCREVKGDKFVTFAFDKASVRAAREAFADWADGIVAEQAKRRKDAEADAKRAELNARRTTCPNHHGGYCSPAKSDCPCYLCGMCVEAKAVEAKAEEYAK